MGDDGRAAGLLLVPLPGRAAHRGRGGRAVAFGAIAGQLVRSRPARMMLSVSMPWWR